MSHPNREQWIAYLYDECAPEEHAVLFSHVETCRACREQVGALRATMKQMDVWKVPAAARRRQPDWAILKWGMAAMLMIGFGFAIARSTSAAPDLNALRAEMEPVVRKQVTAQCQAGFTLLARQIQAQRNEDLQVMTAALKRIDQIDQQREVDYATLRKELETVALNARNRFNITEQQLVQLASTSQSVPSPRP
jgi:hypothetical protein